MFVGLMFRLFKDITSDKGCKEYNVLKKLIIRIPFMFRKNREIGILLVLVKKILLIVQCQGDSFCFKIEHVCFIYL